jgi:hypothetical protein
MSDSPASILFDTFGSQIATVSGVDGVRLATDASGIVNVDALDTLATEATVSGIAQNVSLLEGKDFATETTLASLKAAFDGEDFATQTTLAALLSAFNSEDFSSETTLASLKTAFDAEDFATQTTLDALLTAFNAEDFATQTTLDAFKTNFDNTDFATQTTLAALLTAINNEDFASETTLAAFKSAFDSRDLATETTLVALRTDFNNEDFATQTTLANVDQTLTDVTTASGVAVPVGKEGLLVSSIDQAGIARHLEVIEDETAPGLYRLAITGKVSVQVSPPPQGGTKVTYYADNPLSVSQAISPHDTVFVIPDGQQLVIQQIIAGCQGDSSADGSKCEVVFDDGTEHLVDRIYVMGETQFGNYPDTSEARDGTVIVGNGTNELILRRSRLSNSSQEVDLVVRGYLI